MKILRFCLTLSTCSLLLAGCQKDPEKFVENKPPTVSTGNDTTIELSKAVHSIQLNGSATDSDGTVVSYLWSQVSGPNEATLLSPGSASTVADSLTAGSYVFQLMAVDNKGATGIKSVVVTVFPPQIISINFNLTNNPTETVIGSIYNGNNVQLQELPALYWTNNGIPVESRALLKFDFSSIPSDATIVSAKLSLYAITNPLNGDQVHSDYGSDNAVYIRRITADWNTATLNWTNQPGTTPTNQVVLPATSNSYQNYIDLNVTDLVQDLVTSGNYGMMLQLKNLSLYNIQNFGSSKYADATKHPKLIIEYSK